MSWAEPGWSAMFAVVVALAALLWVMRARHARKLRALVGEGEIYERVLPSSVRLRRRVRDVLAIAGLACLVVALAEPRFDKRMRELKAEGVDLVLAVDLSRSMDAGDVDPSRLTRARREILDLIGLLEGDRVGLVMFAAGAYPRMPLTLDDKALEMIVRELDTRSFQAQGSSLGRAIRESVKLLEHQASEAGRAILVLTDGEVHDPDDALAAAREAASAGVTVYGLVIGTEAAPIPNGDGTFLADPATGERVLSTPSTAVLADVAKITGGAVVRSVPGDEDVRALYEDEIREHVKAAIGRTTRRETWDSAFQWPLAAGVLALLLAGWLGDGRRLALLAAVLLALAPLSAHAEDVRDGDLALRQGRVEEAVRIFTDLTLEHPEDPDLQGWLGTARYRAGDYVGAARAFDRQAELGGDVDARFNAGNAYWRSGRLDRAVQAYDDVLGADPDHPGATQNKPLVTQEIERRRQIQTQQLESEPKPQPGEPKPGGEGEQGKPQPGGDPSAEPQPQDQPQGGQPDGEQPREQQADEGRPGEGEPSSPQEAPRQGGEAGEQDEGTSDQGERAQDGNASTPSLDDVQGEGDEPGGEGGREGQGGGEPRGPSGMTAEQAGRVLDGVEEGSPRVYISGERSEKPW